MTTANSSTINAASLLTRIPESITQISNADDALTLLQAVQTIRGNNILQMLKRDINSSTQYLEQLNSIYSVLKSFGEKTDGPFTQVTAESIKSNPKDSIELRDLFLKDGPNLGKTIGEGDAEIEVLKNMGVAIDAPVNRPVLIDVYAAEKNTIDATKPPVRSGFSWISDVDLKNIEGSTSTSSSDYPGSEARFLTVKDAKGNIVEVVRYTIFSDYAMRRPSLAAVTSAQAEIQNKFDAVLTTLSTKILEVVNGKEKLEDQLKKQKDQFSESTENLDEEKNKATQAIVEFFRIIRQYRQQKDIDKIKTDAAETNINGQTGKLFDNRIDRKSNISALLQAVTSVNPTAVNAN